MAANGLAERRATLARVKTLVGGRVWESALPDDQTVPIGPDGKVKPYIVLDFGAPVRVMSDRMLANPEKGQPHTLPLNAACIAGDADSAAAVAAALFDLLVDWAPSATADPFEAKGATERIAPRRARPHRSSSPGFFLNPQLTSTG